MSDRALTVSGGPTPEELAAVIALVTSAGGDPESPGPPGHRGWSDPARALPLAGRPGPGGWRASAAPR